MFGTLIPGTLNLRTSSKYKLLNIFPQTKTFNKFVSGFLDTTIPTLLVLNDSPNGVNTTYFPPPLRMIGIVLSLHIQQPLLRMTSSPLDSPRRAAFLGLHLEALQDILSAYDL